MGTLKQQKRFVLLLAIIFLLSVTSVFAAWTDILVEISTVMQDLASAFSGGQALEGFLRFCIFVIMYSILYGAASAIQKMKENKAIMRAMNIFSIVMALTVAILIQSDQLLYIFKLYYAILIVLFAILPALVGFLINRRLLQGDQPGYPFIRGIIYLIIAAVLWFVIKTLTVTSSPETAIFDQILGPLKWGALFAFIAGIFNMIMLVPGLRNAIPQGLGGTRGQQGQQQGGQGAVQQPEDPQQILALQREIEEFRLLLEAIPTSLRHVVQAIINRYRTHVVPAAHPPPPAPNAKVTEATHIRDTMIPQARALHEDLNNRAERIIQNNQYFHLPIQIRQQFHLLFQILVNLGGNNTAVHSWVQHDINNPADPPVGHP
jgi:hypothetical protein